MKVIDNLHQYIPKKQHCNSCNSKLEIQFSDLKYEEGYNYIYFICPCCKDRSIPIYRTTEPQEQCHKININDFISAKRTAQWFMAITVIFFTLIFMVILIDYIMNL